MYLTDYIEFLFLAQLIFATKQLVPVDGIFGGTVNCICLTGNGKTFIGTNGGIYAFNDDLEEWELKSKGLDPLRINDILEVEGRLIAVGEYSKGVYLSTDYGENWTNVTIMQGEYETGYLKTLVETEYNGKVILYGASSSGIFKSEDKGSSWHPVKANWSGLGAPIVVSEDGDIYTGNWSSNSPGMFGSTLANDTVWHTFQAVFESGTYTQFLSYGNQIKGQEGIAFDIKSAFFPSGLYFLLKDL